MRTLAIAISFLLLMATGCKKQNEVAVQPENTQAASESQNAVIQQDVAPNGNPQNAVNNQAEPAEANDDSQQKDELDIVDGYVDIAEWCRPGMTEPISAREWAKANNAFGMKFLRLTKGNTVFSPYSIERALGMTLDGACLETATEMLSALEMPNAKRLSLSGRDVDDAMKAVNSDTMLEIDNTLWPDKTLSLPNDYLARIRAGYRNKSIVLDYRTQPELSRITINNDIAKTTHDRIKDLLPPESITEGTRLVLTNAVYFKSKWNYPFAEEATKTEKFYNSDKQTKTQTMHQRGDNENVCIAKDYAIYDLKFNSSSGGDKGTYIMRIVLPTIDDKHPMDNRMAQLDNIEKNLSGDLLSACKMDYYDNVYVAIPKFKLTSDSMSIKAMLESMGMHKAYTTSAEFYAMPNTSPKPVDRSPYLMISDVFHKAFIEIDEKGGEAAAATAEVMDVTASAMPKSREPRNYYFTVNHPFIYMIMEKSTGAAIFMGRVTDL